MARHPISATGTLTNRPGRDLALEVDTRFGYKRRSPTGGSANSVPPTSTYPVEARCSVPISCQVVGSSSREVEVLRRRRLFDGIVAVMEELAEDGGHRRFRAGRFQALALAGSQLHVKILRRASCKRARIRARLEDE